MARTAAELPSGVRITDYISLGVLTNTFPRQTIDEVLARTGRTSRRQRELPAHVVVYYVIALALYMQVSYREVLRCLLEGLQWLAGPTASVKITGKSGISQARTRLGWEPVKALADQLVGPMATTETRGAWYRTWRVGTSAYPQLRMVSLVENGTHVLFGTTLGAYRAGETTLAHDVVAALKPGMLCLADRGFFGWALWQTARAAGADLVWRIKHNLRLPRETALPDGSYLSTIYPSPGDQRRHRNGHTVRVIDYTLPGVRAAAPVYRLVTSVLDPTQAPAKELAALYHERWEIETALDELKTHLRGAKVVLRSKTPDLVRQECYGLLLAHFAIRGLMHEAALNADTDPDRLSFVHAVRVLRRNLPRTGAIPPSGDRGRA